MTTLSNDKIRGTVYSYHKTKDRFLRCALLLFTTSNKTRKLPVFSRLIVMMSANCVAFIALSLLFLCRTYSLIRKFIATIEILLMT